MQFRVIVVTGTARPPVRPPARYRQDRLQYTAPLASAQCNDGGKATKWRSKKCLNNVKDDCDSLQPLRADRETCHDQIAPVSKTSLLNCEVGAAEAR